MPRGRWRHGRPARVHGEHLEAVGGGQQPRLVLDAFDDVITGSLHIGNQLGGNGGQRVLAGAIAGRLRPEVASRREEPTDEAAHLQLMREELAKGGDATVGAMRVMTACRSLPPWWWNCST